MFGYMSLCSSLVIIYFESRSDSQRWNLGSVHELFKNSGYILSHCSLDKMYQSASYQLCIRVREGDAFPFCVFGITDFVFANLMGIGMIAPCCNMYFFDYQCN